MLPQSFPTCGISVSCSNYQRHPLCNHSATCAKLSNVQIFLFHTMQVSFLRLQISRSILTFRSPQQVQSTRNYIAHLGVCLNMCQVLYACPWPYVWVRGKSWLDCSNFWLHGSGHCLAMSIACRGVMLGCCLLAALWNMTWFPHQKLIRKQVPQLCVVTLKPFRYNCNLAAIDATGARITALAQFVQGTAIYADSRSNCGVNAGLSRFMAYVFCSSQRGLAVVQQCYSDTVQWC